MNFERESGFTIQYCIGVFTHSIASYFKNITKENNLPTLQEKISKMVRIRSVEFINIESNKKKDNNNGIDEIIQSDKDLLIVQRKV